MTLNTVSPLRTYALVVGIEKYDAGSRWNNLKGPANDALKFTNWLCRKGVPQENILLFLSPIEGNSDLSADAAPAVQPATRDNLYRGITTTLRQKQGELLYIFWGGHGVITTVGERRLFYADATQETKLNLNLNSLLSSMRTEYFPGFPKQICIVDACAQHVDDLRLTCSLPNEEFTYGGQPRMGREQFVLLAAKAGNLAKNSTAKQTGFFSAAVMKELEEKEADSIWPLNMEELARKLEKQFQGHSQTPTYFWYRDRDDHEGSLGRVPEGFEKDYEYDVFLSYTNMHNNDHTVSWIEECFIPMFRHWLADSLGRNPKIHPAKNIPSTNNALSADNRKALASSRCLVPMWSPPYFFNSFGYVHCSVMRYREEKLGYSPGKLIFPVIVCDGKSFPSLFMQVIPDINIFNCREYIRSPLAFEKSPKYEYFLDRLQEWTKALAEAIDQAPSWRYEWLDDSDNVTIPTFSKPNFPLPQLG